MLRWIAIWSRGLRSEKRRSLAVAALIVVTCLVASAVPRVLAQASNGALRDETAAAPATVRDLELDQVGRIAAGADGQALDPVTAAGAAFQGHYPAPIPSLVSASSLVIDTPHWHTTAGASLTAIMTLRIQQGVESRVRLVAGRAATGATQTINDPDVNAPPGSKLVVLEATVSVATAAVLQVTIGDRLILDPESSDPLAAHRSVRAAVDIVGTYQVIDPADPYWLDDADVDHTGVYELPPFTAYVRATALLAPEAYPALMSATTAARLPMIYRWRSYVTPAAIQASSVDALSDALRRARTLYPPSVATVGNGGLLPGPTQASTPALQTGLLDLLATHQARWQSGAIVLTILWTGAGLVVVASLALVAELIARRRRVALAVARRRGAGRYQVAGAILAEAILLVFPAAAIGAGLSVALIPAVELGPTLAVGATVALVAVALVIRAITGGGEGGSSRVRSARPPGSGRLVAEALVLVLALSGAVVLRQRASSGAVSGTSSGAAAGPAGADPFLAVVPALLGLAIAIVAVRLLPLGLRLLGVVASRQRGVVAVLGTRRAAREGGVVAVLLVALTAVSVGAFASALLDQIDSGARAAAWQAVGADYRVNGPAADLADFQSRQVAGVLATAPIAVSQVALSTGGSRDLLIVDPSAGIGVGAGTPADPELPAEMLGPGDPIPAIVSSGAAGSSAISVGDPFSIRLASDLVNLRVVAVRDGFPGIPMGTPFVVISGTQLGAAHPADVPAPTAVLVRAPGLSLADLQAAVSVRPALTVQSEAAMSASLRGAPAVSAVALGALAAAVAVLAYGLLTIALAIALDTAARRRETARLQVLGLSTRQSVELVLVEFAPAVVIGVVAGICLGVGLFAFVGPALGLPALLGVAALQTSAPDLVRLVLLGALALALIGLATLLSTLLERQTQLAAAVRE